MKSERLITALTVLLGLFLAVGLTGAAASGPGSRAEGPVILTIVGAISQSNRGARDDFADRLMAFQETAFGQAMEFDAAALQKLGMRKLRVQHATWPAAHDFEGPLLRDVLAAAGVRAGTVQPVALDGFAADIPFSDLEKYPVILALKMDRRWLAVGGAGPAWVIYPHNDFPELAKADDSKLVWGVSHIRVMP